jgi:NAD(P)H-dependent FMN reductase
LGIQTVKDKVFDGKPVALMSASTGRLGGARAQYHLRQSFVLLISEPTWTGGRIMPKESIGAETFTYQSKG